MSLFDSYERESEYALNEATKKIASIGIASGMTKDKITREIEDELARVQRSIDSMRQMSLNARPSEGYGSRIQQKENALARVKADFDRSLSVGKGRDDLFAGSGRTSDWARQDGLMRDGMDVNRQRLESTNENLYRAHQMAAETHEIGVNSLNDLQRQRQQLNNAKGGMDQIEEKTSAARRVLGVMRRRVIGNKLILGFIIFVLILGNALIIYFRWGYRRSTSNKTPSAPPTAPHPAPIAPTPIPVPINPPVSIPPVNAAPK